MDDVYENFVRQIAGTVLPQTATLNEDVALYAEKNALQKRMASLARKVKSERQFNRQVEYNRQLKDIKAELAALENGHGQNEF